MELLAIPLAVITYIPDHNTVHKCLSHIRRGREITDVSRSQYDLGARSQQSIAGRINFRVKPSAWSSNRLTVTVFSAIGMLVNLEVSTVHKDSL
jgi:hypothetical protein